MYGQPLLVAGDVIVATENDSVYRLAGASGATVWQVSLGQPVSGDSLPCGDIDPSGITGTPVIDVSSGRVWVLAFIRPHRHVLFALDLGTGVQVASATNDPTGADPTVQQQRAALTLASGRVYVPYGGLYGDCGAYHGWIVSTPTAGGASTSWKVPSGREAGIWAPSGVTVDSAGDVFAATGNSASSDTYDDGNSVIKLSAGLSPLDSFAPADWADLNGSDTDLGSTGPTLVGGLVLQVGKSGVGYLLDPNHLGGVGGQLFSARVCKSGAYGGSAVAGPVALVACKSGLAAVKVAGRRFSVVWNGPATDTGPPIVSAARVWALELGRNQLVGLDLTTGAVVASVPVGAVEHFAAPSVGEGMVVVPTRTGVEAYRG